MVEMQKSRKRLENMNIKDEIRLPSINKVDDKQIIELLNYCRIKHLHEGYIYLFAFIRYSIDHFGEKRELVKLYEKIAQRFNTNKTAVERCVRHAIQSSNMPKITNGEFVAEAVNSLIFGTDIIKYKNDDCILTCTYCGSGDYLSNEGGHKNTYCGQCGQKVENRS